MNPILIPVKRLRDAPLQQTIELAPEAIDVSEPEFQFSKIDVDVTYTAAGQSVLGVGELHTSVESRCVRCLEPAHAEVTAPVNEVWMPLGSVPESADPDEDEEETLVHPYSDDAIDPSEVYRELLLLEVPDYPLCKPDCKGLCPGCGADLNNEPCRCAPASADESAPGSEEKESDRGKQVGNMDETIPEWKRKLKNLKIGE